MSETTRKPWPFGQWLEAVESLALLAESASLALAALGASRHGHESAHMAGLLSELARLSTEASEDVIRTGKQTSKSWRAIGARAAELCAEGWSIMNEGAQ